MSCSLKALGLSAKNGEREIFRGVNLSVGHKEKVAILGANGQGKTSLLQILGGLRQWGEGEIGLFGEKLDCVEDFVKFRHEIGFLFQNSDDQFLCASVFEDVAFSLRAQNERLKRAQNAEKRRGIFSKFFGRKTQILRQGRENDHLKKLEILSEEQIERKVLETLRRLGIEHLRERVPFHLSGGEKKLVALAGALVCEPRILLLDEPTTALDEAMQERVAGILAGLDVSEIIVSHDKNFIDKIADKIYYLKSDGLYESP
ncbi:ABC transporter ATP-binding protein [uncultured Campylobacter sp.]|uniref:energy-coupling factor ABC transporter ATP-binding protein n=1 Tax=uncultured Campylobacter sp. TaxID=218934 RepID=UPI0028E59164|nr:ABC transporter ATP-binding protein [uncultured Campylobacter sp.]